METSDVQGRRYLYDVPRLMYVQVEKESNTIAVGDRFRPELLLDREKARYLIQALTDAVAWLD